MSMENFFDDCKATAANCNHYGMCKLDFLGIGVCPSGKRSKYVAYYPQGRMEIVSALANGLIPVTVGLAHIADDCGMCRICDKQCSYLTKNRVGNVMQTLKDFVKQHVENGGPVIKPPEDAFLDALQEIVGPKWASNDPAILVAYSRDKGLGDRHLPKYVVMVGSEEEAAAVIRLARGREVPYTLRSNGGNGWSATLGTSLIIDFHRMDSITIDKDTWTATIEPGVSGFNLQTEAARHGMRACVGEASACICANLLDTEINSLFSSAYGMGTDLIVNAHFTGDDGKIHATDAKGIKFLNHTRMQSPDACTRMTVKLFPKSEDETGLFIPFHDFEKALELSRTLAKRGIGFVNGVISARFASFCLTLTSRAEKELFEVMQDKMKINYLLVVCVDKYDKESIKRLTDVYLDQEAISTVMESVSKLSGDEGLDLLSEIPTDKHPYEMIFREDMNDLSRMILSPSRDDAVKYADDDLKDFYKDLLSNPRFEDCVYLNLFRINSARLARRYRFFPMLMRISLNDVSKVNEIMNNLKEIGGRHGLIAEFGNANPSKFGKWAMIEFDFFFTDDNDRARVVSAFNEASKMLHDYKDNKKAAIDSFYPKGFVYRDEFYSYSGGLS